MKILKFKVILIALLLCQNINYLNSQIQSKPIFVKYISEAPKIDGYLDKEMEKLPVQNFPVISKSNLSNPDININYRIAYSSNFFYLCVEVESNELICRDRGYQNGDGFHMVLCKTKPDCSPADEFFVLACSAVNNINQEWSRKFFWYYNVSNIFRLVSDDTKMEFSNENGKITFELYLPWKDVYPYHPWLSKDIGFNLCFVKAIGDQDKNEYKTLNAQLDQENSTRKYLTLDFEKPYNINKQISLIYPESNHLIKSKKLTANIITLSPNDNEEKIKFRFYSGENDQLKFYKKSFRCKKGINITSTDLTIGEVPAGGYKLKWNSVANDSKGETFISIINKFDKAELLKRTFKIKNKISKSSFETICFKINETDQSFKKLKSYETCGKLRMKIAEILEILKYGEAGKDLISEKRGFVRKAYKSKLDNTYQPYVVGVPKHINKDTKYPLIVYLHGSGSDENNIKSIEHFNGESFISLSPFGRGTSNCYSWNNSQKDISEAIESVCKNYPVDKKNIILTGFSMGGYGVYRTYYETPDKFKAIAVFSGHPDLANQWDSDNKHHPDFTKKRYLKKFKSLPIFIFHGEEDRNCSFQITNNIVDKLKSCGAKVTYITEKYTGHETPGSKTINKFKIWLQNQMHINKNN